MMYKGGIKIFFLLLIMLVIGLSAMMFSFEDQNIAGNVQDKAQEAIKEGSEKVIDKVTEEGRVAVGEKLKETGEKMMVVENEQPGSYQKYDEGLIAQHEKNILFFTATWCPSCINVEMMLETQKNLIPTTSAIFTVNLDEHAMLREKYHVERPHTFIQIDRDGNEMARWSGDTTLEDIMSHVQ